MFRLYDYLDSGNGYTVRLLLHRLKIPYDLIEVDIMKGETHTPEFLARNPIGKIPTLQLEDGGFLAESGAILFYLAEGTKYLPTDRLARAQVLQWMFFEQYSHEPYVAVARFWLKHLGLDERRGAELAEKQEKGRDALGVMESHLAKHDYLVGEAYTIADIALYAYTHVAAEGGFDLGGYPAIRGWLDRVRGQPGHVEITQH